MTGNDELRTDQALALLRGKGQPLSFVLAAVQIASSPDDVRELMGCTVFGERPARPWSPRPPVRAWMTMYRRHRRMQDELAAGSGLPVELTASGVMGALRAAPQLTREEIAAEVASLSPEEQRSFLRLLTGVPFPPDDATLRDMLAALDAHSGSNGPKDEPAFGALMASATGQFFFRVWWPCWILYHTYPPVLLRAARGGDLESLDRLLRLDKYVVHDPGVARVVGDVMSSRSTNNKKRICNALVGHPTVKLTDASIRAALAGLISQLAFLFGTKVTAPQIQKLFDLIARVRTGELIDVNLPESSETWSKGVQRARTWPSLPTRPAGQ